MTAYQFFSIDFATVYPDIFYYNTTPINYKFYRIHGSVANHFNFRINFKDIDLICKDKYGLYYQENRNKFIDWFADYARSIITEDCVISGSYIF